MNTLDQPDHLSRATAIAIGCISVFLYRFQGRSTVRNGINNTAGRSKPVRYRGYFQGSTNTCSLGGNPLCFAHLGEPCIDIPLPQYSLVVAEHDVGEIEGKISNMISRRG